jgi:hypothetical protein
MRALAIDLRSLALLRIALGVILVLDTLDRIVHWRIFFTDDGPWPLNAARRAASWSLVFVSSHRYATLTLFVAQVATALALTLGWHTRVMIVLSWLLLVSAHARNGLILHGGDLELRLLLFWCMALPLGAQWSLDARRDPTHAGEVRSVASTVLVLQIAMIYVTSALLKSDPAWWRDGTAIAEALRLTSYTRNVADVLLTWPRVLRGLTYATLVLEGLAPIVLVLHWRSVPWRIAVPLAFMLLHAGIGVSFRLGLFPFVGAAAWVVVLPGALWQRLGAAPALSRPCPTSRVASYGVAVCFVLAVMCALRPWSNVIPPGPLYRVAGWLRLDQRWDLFAPRPLQTDGWFVVEATLTDGRTLDLLTGAPPVERSRASLRSLYPSVRWRRFFVALRRPERHDARRSVVAWAIDRYQRVHPLAPRTMRAALVRETIATDTEVREREVFDP